MSSSRPCHPTRHLRRGIHRLLALTLALGCSALGAIEHPVEQTSITVTASSRQTFGGFGVSISNPGETRMDYGELPTAVRKDLARHLWTDGRARIARLWLDLGDFNPAAGRYDLSEFERRFLASRLLPDAVAAGCSTILLAPTNLPRHLRVRREGGASSMRLKNDASAVAYGQAVARAIVMLHQRYGVLVDATGVQNEPSSRVRLTPTQFRTATRALRQALDRAGSQYRGIRIVGPETASVDQTCETYLKALRADPVAWNAIDGIASHSYNMCLTPGFARRWLQQGRPYWNTEAGNVEFDPSGRQLAIGTRHGTSLAARALNDIRLGCSHWIWFLGYEHASYASGDGHRLIRYTERGEIELLPSYHFFKLLARSIPVGSRILELRADRDLGHWSYGPKPRLTAAAARGGDGSLSVLLCNYSSNAFADRSRGTDFQRDNRGEPATVERVTLRLERELGIWDGMATVTRIGPDHKDSWTPSRQVVAVKQGRLQIDVRPLELVVLSAEPPSAGTERDGGSAAGGTPSDTRSDLELGKVTITLRGQVEPGTESMTIDERPVEIDRSTGSFEVEVVVAPGESELPVRITLADGRVVQRQLQLSRSAATTG